MSKHKLLCKLVNRKLSRMDEWEIRKRCPPEYGETITYDHLNLVWDRLYDEYAAHSTPILLVTIALEE